MPFHFSSFSSPRFFLSATLSRRGENAIFAHKQNASTTVARARTRSGIPRSLSLTLALRSEPRASVSTVAQWIYPAINIPLYRMHVCLDTKKRAFDMRNVRESVSFVLLVPLQREEQLRWERRFGRGTRGTR